MKKAALVFISLFFIKGAFAVEYRATGAVSKIYSLDRTSLVEKLDSFSIQNFTTAGGCATNDGLVGITLRDDEGGKRQLSMILSAKVTGTTLNVRVDDEIKTAQGYCYLQVLEMN